jgi:polyhydroxybutyrate depolymerase
MNRSRIGTLSAFTLLILAACSASDDGAGLDPTAGSGSGGSGVGTGGSTAQAGALANAGTTTAGTSSSAGMAGSAPAAGTSSTAGTASGGGGSSSGGTASAGSSSGGATTGGSGGGSNLAAKPSAGCSKASAQVTIPNSLVGVPPGYTGTTPVPVVIAFHAAGNDNTSIQNAFKSSDLAKKYLMVYPNSTSATTANKTGWNMQADKNRYLEVQAAISAQACVDENRIYATGHSSGAQFVVALLCSGDGAFDAVAPVASSVSCQKWKNGAVPALVIHGVQDEERTKYNLNDGDGKKDLQPYLTSNMCQMTSTPFQPDVSKCNNIQGVDGKAFSPGCVEFSGCSVKTRWCNHNDPNYGTTNHGIPCFGVRSIYDFFESL